MKKDISYSNFELITFGVVLVLCLWSLHIIKTRFYRKKFNGLIAFVKVAISSNKDPNVKSLDIAPEVVQRILKNLEKFEHKKKYIEKNMTSARLATLLSTNTKYVSKIILMYRGKKTIDYISDLKIEYIIELLKTEKIYHHYTNKALAEKAGFGSTQSFTKAFKTRSGISPTFFIQALKKKEELRNNI